MVLIWERYIPRQRGRVAPKHKLSLFPVVYPSCFRLDRYVPVPEDIRSGHSFFGSRLSHWLLNKEKYINVCKVNKQRFVIVLKMCFFLFWVKT